MYASNPFSEKQKSKRLGPGRRLVSGLGLVNRFSSRSYGSGKGATSKQCQGCACPYIGILMETAMMGHMVVGFSANCYRFRISLVVVGPTVGPRLSPSCSFCLARSEPPTTPMEIFSRRASVSLRTNSCKEMFMSQKVQGLLMLLHDTKNNLTASESSFINCQRHSPKRSWR